MATERGWWTLTSTVPLSDTDRDHIGQQITKGFTEGEVCVDEPDPPRLRDHERRFAGLHLITATSKFTSINDYGHTVYTVTLRRPGAPSMTLPFRLGPGVAGPPPVEVVLGALADDAATVISGGDFEGWAQELGYDLDDPAERRAREADHRRVVAQVDQLSVFLGSLFDELLWESPDRSRP